MNSCILRAVLFRRPGEKQNGLQYSLVVTLPDGASHTVAVDDAPVTVGRSPSATVCLNQESVSRQHCMVTPSSGRLMLLDQGSTNGTKVNGNKVRRARLSHGDLVEIGATRIHVRARTGGGTELGSSTDAIVLKKHAIRKPPLPHELLALLKRVIARLSICRSAESVGSVIADAALDAFPAERVVVLARDAASVGAEGTILSMKRRGERPLKKVELETSVIKRVIASGKTERHIAPPLETLSDTSAALSERPSHPVLCAPLRNGLDALGVLYLDAPEMPDWVGSAESLSLIATLGDLAGMALGDGRLDLHISSRIERETPLSSDSNKQLERLSRGSVDESIERGHEELVQQLSELGDLTREQQSTVEELKHNLERCVEDRAEVIEEQRIELAARLTELQHLQHTRAMMSRALVHDIRNLVSALTANLSFVQMSLMASSEESVSLDAAHLCAKRIISMAEDVLDVSRMEEGTFPVETKRVSVWGLLTEALRRHAAQARELGIEIELGEVERDLHVLADAEVLSRVLDNLIDNALRYAGYGGSVRLEAQREHLATELCVIDSGPGIDPDQREQVFNEGVTVNPGELSRHHGIGLFFCRLAAKAHGGAIRIEGTSGDNRLVLSLPSFEDPPVESSLPPDAADEASEETQ